MAAGAVIPVASDVPQTEFLRRADTIIERFNDLTNVLGPVPKIAKTIDNIREGAVSQVKNIWELLQVGPLSKAQAKFLTIKNKLYKVYDKYIVKGKFFKKLLSGLKTIVKGIASMAGNWFLKILGFLLLMSIIDPKGKLLKSIIMMIANLVVWFIQAVARMLPVLIPIIINLVTTVIPNIMRSVINAILPALSKMFGHFANLLEKNHPILAWIFRQLQKAFSKDGIVYKFLMFLVSIFPILLAGFLIIGFIVKILPFLKILFVVLKYGFIILKGIFIAVKALVMFLSANPIVLIIAAVIAGLILLWIYWDKVSAFFKRVFSWIGEKISAFVGWIGSIVSSIVNWFKNLSMKWKFFIGLLLAPLLPFIAMIYGTVKLFQYIKKVGIKQFLKNIWGAITDFFTETIPNALKSFWKTIKKFAKKVWGWIKKGFSKIGAFLYWVFISPLIPVKNAFSKIVGLVGKIFEPMKGIMKLVGGGLGKGLNLLTTAVSRIYYLVRRVILATINKVRNAFRSVQAFFSGIATFGWKWISPVGGLSAAEKARYTRFRKRLGRSDVDVSILEQLAKTSNREKVDPTLRPVYDVIKRMGKDWKQIAERVASGKVSATPLVRRQVIQKLRQFEKSGRSVTRE